MPKSKRAKVVHLTKVDKKGKEHTIKLYSNIQECLDKYTYCFVFSVDNMRNTFLKQVRNDLPDSRLFFGKTKVMAKALGTTPESAHQPGTDTLAAHLRGNVGLLCTSRAPAAVVAHFAAFHETDYARSGTVAPRDFVLPPGVVRSTGGETVPEEDGPMAHSMEPELRRLGVPTRLVAGRIELDGEYVVCEEGKVLDSRQTRLLKMFGVATAEFRVRLVAYWSAATHEVTEIESEEMDE